MQFRRDLTDPVVDGLEHGREMRVVIDGPVMSRTSLAKARVFAQIASITSRLSGRMLANVLLHQVGPAIENRVRCIVAQVEEERLVAMSLDEVHGLLVQPVREVLALAESLVGDVEPTNWLRAKHVRPEVRAVANPFDFTAEVPRKAVVLRFQFVFSTVIRIAGQMPLADLPCGVTVSAQHLGKGDV